MIQRLPHFSAKKQVNSYAKHLSSVFTWFFKCWTHQEIILLKKFWKVLWYLFCCVFWGRDLFCLVSESKESRGLSQYNLHQICEFTLTDNIFKSRNILSRDSSYKIFNLCWPKDNLLPFQAQSSCFLSLGWTCSTKERTTQRKFHKIPTLIIYSQTNTPWL